MADIGSYAALSGILSNLAKPTPADNDPFVSRVSLQGTKSGGVQLPGPDTADKRALEKEIGALVGRIQLLETRAVNAAQGSLPITPNEPLASSPFSTANSTPTRNTIQQPRQRSASWVNNLLSKKEGTNGDAMPHQLTEEQLGLLREHVDKQAGQIKSQSEYIESINVKLEQQQLATKEALSGIEKSVEDVETLKRELSKNQQINASYQKVLREIGSIITAVANGDLSKKVLINAKERDPEIATFKHTINKMVDQLQEFASQVTHLAKDVGTEGRLGGQAVLVGVDGIWAELTENGTVSRGPTTLPFF